MPSTASACRPASSTTVRAASAATSGSWVTSTAVRPATMRSSASRTSAAVTASRLAVGSSTSTSAGSRRAMRASARRRRSPALAATPPSPSRAARPPGSPAAHGSRPAAASAAHSCSSPACASARRRFSASVAGSSTGRCGIHAICARHASRSIAASSSPPQRTDPLRTGCSPSRTRSRVDLPAPLGPTTAVASPGAISSDRSLERPALVPRRADRDPLEHDRVRARVRDGAAGRPRHDPLARARDLEQAPQGRPRVGRRVVLDAGAPQRAVDLRREQEHDERVLEGHRPVHEPHARDDGHQRRPQHRHELEREAAHERRAQRADGRAAVGVAGDGELLALDLRAPEAAQHRQPARHVEQVRAEQRHRGEALVGDALRVTAREHEEDDQQRQGRREQCGAERIARRR